MVEELRMADIGMVIIGEQVGNGPGSNWWRVVEKKEKKLISSNSLEEVLR